MDETPTTIPGQTHQLVVVTATDWDSTSARVQLLERAGTDSSWERVGSPFEASLGRNGLAWGDSSQPHHKVEGDGRAPAGIFALSSAFGYADTADTRLPYTRSTEHHFCVDDVNSRYYNQIVSDADVGKDWNSAETMILPDDRYKWGVVVDYNRPNAVTGRGSCIFLHLWKEPGYPTSGCTAMSEESMLRLLRWLDPAAKPLLVQLPMSEHEGVREAWGLPGSSR